MLAGGAKRTVLIRITFSIDVVIKMIVAYNSRQINTMAACLAIALFCDVEARQIEKKNVIIG